MKRREFIASGLGGLAVLARPVLAARRVPVIGFLSGIVFNESIMKFFSRGLSEAGYVVGANVRIEYRSAQGQYDRLQALAAELERLPVDVIVAGPSSPVALAAQAATSSIPIVFSIGADPVRLGLVQTYNKPGGNVTGMAILADELSPKRIEILHQMVPRSFPIAELLNSSNSNHEEEKRISEQAVRTLGRDYIPVRASNKAQIEAAFAIIRGRNAALTVSFEAYFASERALIVSLAARDAIPTIYGTRLFTEAGGLISYGPNLGETWRLVGGYTAKVLDGASPANLPVMQPTKFDLVINIKTAKALHLTVPPALLARADEVIE